MNYGMNQTKKYEYRITTPKGIISGILGGIAFSLIGAFCTFVCILGLIDDMKIADYGITNATIIDMEVVDGYQEYKISYTVDNKEYIKENTFSGDDRNIGDAVTIRYDKENPNTMAYHNNPGFIFPIVSIIMLVFGVMSLISSIRSLKFYLNPVKYKNFAPISKVEVNKFNETQSDDETIVIRTEEDVTRFP